MSAIKILKRKKHKLLVELSAIDSLIRELRVKTKGEEQYKPARARAALKEKYGSKCETCGIELNFEDLGTSDSASVDHIIPKSHGGTNHLRNLRLLCRNCNCTRGLLHGCDKGFTEFDKIRWEGEGGLVN